MTRTARFTRRVSVPLTPELTARLLTLAEAWGMSEAHVARRLMEEAPMKVEPVARRRKKS